MSKQDADDTEPPSETADEGVENDDAGGETLDDIAEEPEADPTELLEELAAESEEKLTLEINVSAEEPPAELLEKLQNRSKGTLAAIVAGLAYERKRLDEELDELEERAEDLESRLKRKQADFQNYKKRQQERLEDEKKRATEDLVTRLLDVRDNLARALEQDEDADIRGGVESTLSQFDDELDRENVSVIEPEPGTEVDPERHEVLITVESQEPEDTVAERHRSGYEMAGKVLRPAQVAVSDGSLYEEDPDSGETETANEAGKDVTEGDRT